MLTQIDIHGPIRARWNTEPGLCCWPIEEQWPSITCKSCRRQYSAAIVKLFQGADWEKWVGEDSGGWEEFIFSFSRRDAVNFGTDSFSEFGHNWPKLFARGCLKVSHVPLEMGCQTVTLSCQKPKGVASTVGWTKIASKLLGDSNEFNLLVKLVGIYSRRLHLIAIEHVYSRATPLGNIVNNLQCTVVDLSRK